MRLVMRDMGETSEPAIVAAAAVEGLGTLLRQLLTDQGYSPTKELPSELGIMWRPGIGATQLIEMAHTVVADYLADQEAIGGGRVYCYHCGLADCEHSEPPEPGQVFVGYQPTGRPNWQEFFQYLLELGDERVEQVFTDSNQILSRIVGRKRLISEQLVEYGRRSRTYAVIGQVVAGYFSGSGVRSALTFQVVEKANRDLEARVIASSMLLEQLADAQPARDLALYRTFDLIRSVTGQIEVLSPLWRQATNRKERGAVTDKIFTLLRHFANGIERSGRQTRRRTLHARERASQQRPVHTAHDDVARASVDAFFEDQARGSIVILGRRSRAHVYAREGTHITSFTLKRSELERRQKRNRYVPLTEDQVGVFRKACASNI